MRLAHGVTRTIVIGDHWVMKIPGGQGFSYHHRPMQLVRGWMANRSEWKQRRRPDVARPWFTLGYWFLFMPRAEVVGTETHGIPDPAIVGDWGDESKSSSWGLFSGEWKLLDFDRAWEHPRGLIGGAYYWLQERSAMRWAGTDEEL